MAGESENVQRGFDAHGNVSELLHAGAPFRAQATAPQLGVHEYLTAFGAELGIEPAQLDNLAEAPESRPVDAQVEYRFDEAKTQFDTTTYAYQQTYFGLPVWRAGVSVHLKTDPMRVIGAQSTLHREIAADRPSAAAADALAEPRPLEVAAVLGLTRGEKVDAVKTSRLVVYRYDAARRLADAPEESHDRPLVHPVQPGPVDASIVDGRHYVATEVVFALATPTQPGLTWRAIVELETRSLLYLRPFIDTVGGMVFLPDPITSSGDGTKLPSAANAPLNTVRHPVTLLGLTPPPPGTNQKLEGEFVKIVDFERATVPPPTRPAGADFAYDVRTNNFAAVSAYYHCDGFFRTVASLGFPIARYFDQTAFPIPVDHRGSYGSIDGIERNASCSGDGVGGIANVDFELADLGDTVHPIGIANDGRVVLHELGGHGILYEHVNGPNFGFAHSAGDSFGAILSDPESMAPDRFATFPWVNFVDRRHDRKVAGGWGWGGFNDDGGYGSEQILCTTHFRIYRALGGDSPDLAQRRFASRFAIYLILRAVGSLTPATNPEGPGGYANALRAADLGDWTTESHAGGAYGKVIRWAFERQGLYQPPFVGRTEKPGAPPAVDVYIDDGRHGEYGFQPNFWSTRAVWNRRKADGVALHQEPVAGVPNFAYVKVENRGTQVAKNVVVKGYHAKPSTGLAWPGDWKPMTTAQHAAPNLPAHSAGEHVVGPFQWTPSQLGHECMLMIVSATGDASNVGNLSAGESIPDWRLVPHDNNIAQRNVHPIPAITPAVLETALRKRPFSAGNPGRKAGKVVVTVTLPKLLRERGWRHAFENPGGGTFSLPPGGSKQIELGLRAGKPFTAAELKKLKLPDRTIRVEARVDGIVTGGLAFELDPARKS